MTTNFYLNGCPKCRYVRHYSEAGPQNRCVRCGYKANDQAEREEAERKNAQVLRQNERFAHLEEMRMSEEFSIRDLLSAYEGENILINLDDPGKVSPGLLRDVRKDHFCIETSERSHFVPLSQVIRVTVQGEAAHAVGRGKTLTVLVFDLVIYKGAFGMGFSMPI